MTTPYDILSEYAKQHGVPARTVRLWCIEGRIACIRHGRFWFVRRDAEPVRYQTYRGKKKRGA